MRSPLFISQIVTRRFKEYKQRKGQTYTVVQEGRAVVIQALIHHFVGVVY